MEDSANESCVSSGYTQTFSLEIPASIRQNMRFEVPIQLVYTTKGSRVADREHIEKSGQFS